MTVPNRLSDLNVYFSLEKTMWVVYNDTDVVGEIHHTPQGYQSYYMLDGGTHLYPETTKSLDQAVANVDRAIHHGPVQVQRGFFTDDQEQRVERLITAITTREGGADDSIYDAVVECMRHCRPETISRIADNMHVTFERRYRSTENILNQPS